MSCEIVLSPPPPPRAKSLPKPILVTKRSTDNNELQVETFRMTYFGSLPIDRRYMPNVFQWVVKLILRKHATQCETTARISHSVLSIMGEDGTAIHEYSFESIYRLSRLKHCDLGDFLAYVTGKNENDPAYFHVFKCSSLEQKDEFLKSLKTHVLGFQKLPSPKPPTKVRSIVGDNLSPPRPTHKRGTSSGAILVSSQNSEHVFCDHVHYIGKVNITQPQAPPKFIDDVLVQLRKMQGCDLLRRQRRSVSGPISNHHCSDEHLNRTEDKDMADGGFVGQIFRRKRSVSVDSKDMNEGELPEEEDTLKMHSIQEEVQSRKVTLKISKTSIMLFSIETKALLLEKKIKNISFCTKGEIRSDYFGFICRESGNHTCFIFQGESQQKVDILMKAMKKAFVDALEASAHLTLCETCPLHFFHKVCTNIDGARTLTEKKNVFDDAITRLSEYEQLLLHNTINEEISQGGDELEVSVNVLREVIDQKQASHKHSHKVQQLLNGDGVMDRERSRSTIFEQAKKKLTTSLQNFATKKPTMNGKDSPGMQRKNHQSADDLKQRSSSVTFSSSSCPTTPVLHTRRLEFNFDKEEEQQDECADLPAKNEPQSARGGQRKPSWRQAIYHSVTTPRRDSCSSVATLPESDGEKIDTSARARTRWKNAIHNQILLIRMDKENKKLAAKITATDLRRQKLSYQEHGSFSAESATQWDDILARDRDDVIDQYATLEAIRGGIPRARRGEVWQFLIHQFTLRAPVTDEFWKRESYRSLLKRTTSHQHAILIDLGRTFPTHEHFIPRLGAGQLSLFNILKAYSLIDTEVGYCQGLSFVAGIFLMHMSEEDAFRSFCHLMFDLQIRNQYKPDMDAVQQQLYQLSRLIHDYHPTLYEHLNSNDVTPTLYAAPWFLTLFASQYPVGFASRVMDMILLQGIDVVFKVALVMVGDHKDEVLKCDSFETIVEYLKTTLTEKVPTNTDNICNRVLNMDITSQLHLYEVEYQLLKDDEMVDIRQSKEKLERQELAQKRLEDKVVSTEQQLQNALNEIKTLKCQLEESNSVRDDYRRELDNALSEITMLKGEEDVKKELPLIVIDANLRNGYDNT